VVNKVEGITGEPGIKAALLLVFVVLELSCCCFKFRFDGGRQHATIEETDS